MNPRHNLFDRFHTDTMNQARQVMHNTEDRLNQLLVRQMVLSRAWIDCLNSTDDNGDIHLPGFTIIDRTVDRIIYDGWCRLIAWNDRDGVKGTHVAQIIGRAKYGPEITREELQQLAKAIDTIIGLTGERITDQQILDLSLLTRIPLSFVNIQFSDLTSGDMNEILTDLARLNMVHGPSRLCMVHNGRYYEVDTAYGNRFVIPRVRGVDTSTDRLEPGLPRPRSRSPSPRVRSSGPRRHSPRRSPLDRAISRSINNVDDSEDSDQESSDNDNLPELYPIRLPRSSDHREILHPITTLGDAEGRYPLGVTRSNLTVAPRNRDRTRLAEVGSSETDV